MKSTIKIALGSMNEPIIEFFAVDTQDVRDILCTKFWQALNYTSNLAFVEFGGSAPGLSTPYTRLTISPISGGEEDKWINRLTIEQCKAIIPLALQTLGEADRTNTLVAAGVTTEQSANLLPSKYQIEDTISTEEIYDGEVVSVKFTIGKVYYDILDKLTGKVVYNVDSALLSQESTNN